MSLAPPPPAAGQPATPPVAAQIEAKPGAAGIGDAYFPESGNGGYDVSDYEIRLRYSPSDDQLTGTTTVTLTPTQSLSRFNLDFALEVSAVAIDAVKAQFARENEHELVITPAKPLIAGRTTYVVVTYTGVPSKVRLQSVKRSPWWRTRDGAIGAGAPENAWWWFPSNDHPLDKATFTVAVTVPDGITAISNGVQSAPPTAADAGWTTWTWRSSKPQQPYLALLVIGEYELVQSTSASGVPVTLAYPKHVDTSAARPSLERTAEIVHWEESMFGPYPFEALGGVIAPSDGINYALENQTRPIYPLNYFSGGSGDVVIVHELAHQWFGDSVALARWRDVWLSEGFATYAEWLWSEAHGNGSAQELFDAAYARYPANSDFWRVLVSDPGKARIYDQAVYQRGAMTLHRVRLAVGDDKFFEILKAWSATHRHGNGTSEEFVALASATSGQNLDALFKAWLFTAERPALP